MNPLLKREIEANRAENPIPKTTSAKPPKPSTETSTKEN